MTGITVANLQKAYGHKVVLDNVNIDVADGEFVCLLGPSGCGKSTLLRSIAGLETPEDGSIHLGTDAVFDASRRLNLPPERRELGMVFQSFALWPHRSVFENVAYPLRRQKVGKSEIARRVQEALAMVDLWEHRDRYPGTLSGGQQQRVALARAVVGQPRLLLLDEPLSSLDTNLRGQMRREIRRIQQHLGATAVYVTHDKEDAGGLADRVIVLQEGKIVQEGMPRDVFVSPHTAFVAEFVGFDNFIQAQVVSAERERAIVRVGTGSRLHAATRGPVEVGAQVTVAVRSRMITVAPADSADSPPGDNSFLGRVVSKAHLGDDVELIIQDGVSEFVARVRPGQSIGIHAGDDVVVVFPEGAVVVVSGTPKATSSVQ